MELLDERRRVPRVRLLRKREATVPFLNTAEAVQVGLDRDVEVRILPGGASEAHSEVFFQELKDLSRLDHPAFLPVLGDMALKGRPCYLVPLRDHPSLADLVADRGFSLDARCQAVRALADALAAAHEQDVSLGPVPPERIAWDRLRGQLYYRHHLVEDEAWGGKRLEHTPLARRPGRMRRKDDVLAWGLLAFWLLTRGQDAYGAGPDDLRPLRRLQPKVSPGLAKVVESSLAWDDRFRPHGGPELRAVLELDRQNVVEMGPPPDDRIDMPKVSSEVLERVEHLRSSGEIPRRPRRDRPKLDPVAQDQALRQDASLVGEDDGGAWQHQAARHGLHPGAAADDDEARPRRGRWILWLVLVLAALGAAYLGRSLARAARTAAPSPPHSEEIA